MTTSTTRSGMVFDNPGKAPYRESMDIRTWDGDWTAEQIAAGEAGPGRFDGVQWQWHEWDGTPITDPERLADLDARYPIEEVHNVAG